MRGVMTARVLWALFWPPDCRREVVGESLPTAPIATALKSLLAALRPMPDP